MKKTIIMRERRDIYMTRRTLEQEHDLGQETHFIPRHFAGGDSEAEQASRRMPEYCRHSSMTTSSVLDLCLVQTQRGYLKHFCPSEDSAWSARVKDIVQSMRSDFDASKFRHLPQIINHPFLRHLSVDVTKPAKTPIAHAQARTAARMVFGDEGACGLFDAIMRLLSHQRRTMVSSLNRMAQVQEACHDDTLEEHVAPMTSEWGEYAGHLMLHILDPFSQWSRRTLREGGMTDLAHTSVTELFGLVDQIALEMPSRCKTVKGAVNCMRLGVPHDWSKADLLRATLLQIQTGTLPNSAASDPSWDVEMLTVSMLLGQLAAIKRIMEVQNNRRRAEFTHVVSVPPLQEGGQPTYAETIEETATETSPRIGLTPSHTTVMALNGEEHERGRERNHFPALNFGCGYRLEGLRSRSLSPSRLVDGRDLHRSRRWSFPEGIVTFAQGFASQELHMTFLQGFASQEPHMSPSRRTSSSESDAGNGPDSLRTHPHFGPSHQVSQVIQAAVRQDQPLGALPVPPLLALGALARRFRDGPGSSGRGPAYGTNSSRAGYCGTLEQFFCTQYGGLIDDLGSIDAIEAFMFGLRDSESLLDQTHAFIIARAILARVQQHLATDGPISPDWRAVVRALTLPVRVSVVSWWPEELTAEEHNDILVNWRRHHPRGDRTTRKQAGPHEQRQEPRKDFVRVGRPTFS